MPRDAGTASTRRWERFFESVGILVVLLFVGALVFTLFLGGGDQGHGGGMPGPAPSEGGQGGNVSTTEGHRPPPGFVPSFGFKGLVVAGGYLAVFAVWAAWRGNWMVLVRHEGSAAATLILVVLYLYARGSFSYDGHNWNRSFADASVVLYTVTLAIGPLARLWRPATHALAWRRETGIWATIAAIMHVGIFWEWSLGWDWRPFFYPGEHGNVANTLMGDRSQGLSPTPFNLANVVGLVALVYAVVLTIASNDASQRWLKSGWSWLMQRATTMQTLVLLHTWLFAYYITREQTLPVGTLWASFGAVLLLQTFALAKTVQSRRRLMAGGASPRSGS